MAATDFIQAIHHLKIAKEFFHDIQRACGEGAKGYRLAKQYESRIEWIYRDLLSNPNFNEDFRDGLKEEWASDSFIFPALMEKIAALTPENREVVEDLIILILKGESINVVIGNTDEIKNGIK